MVTTTTVMILCRKIAFLISLVFATFSFGWTTTAQVMAVVCGMPHCHVFVPQSPLSSAPTTMCVQLGLPTWKCHRSIVAINSNDRSSQPTQPHILVPLEKDTNTGHPAIESGTAPKKEK
jgi:hypothetical protein